MSKSIGGTGTVWVLDDPKTITKKVKSAVTDTGRRSGPADDKPGITNLLTILSVCTGTPVPELEAAYEGKGYGDFKADVAQAVVELTEPVRQRYAELVADHAHLDAVLARGAERAGSVAEQTMAAVRERIGLLAPGAEPARAPPRLRRRHRLPEPYTSELAVWRARLGDPNAAGIPPHITLLPPTSLHDEELPEVEEHLRVVAASESAFEVHLRGSADLPAGVAGGVRAAGARHQRVRRRVEAQVAVRAAGTHARVPVPPAA
jgi:hypothetical protein